MKIRNLAGSLMTEVQKKEVGSQMTDDGSQRSLRALDTKHRTSMKTRNLTGSRVTEVGS